MCSLEKDSGRERDNQSGFVYALWLLVVLSALLFGATLVNIGIGMKIYEVSSRQSTAIERLSRSVREVEKAVLYLSKVIEDADQPAEEDSDGPVQGGRI
jgi:hypothetical protein